MKGFIKAIRFIPAAVWMYIIYWFSNQAWYESTDQSSGFTYTLVNAIATPSGMDMDTRMKWVVILEPYVRKLCHMGEYAILFLLLFFAIRYFAGDYYKKVFITLCLCFLYACSDEIHQLHVPGRSGQLSDVVVDSLGAVIIMLIIIMIHRKRNKTKEES